MISLLLCVVLSAPPSTELYPLGDVKPQHVRKHVQFFKPYQRPAVMKDGCVIPYFPPKAAIPVWCDTRNHTCAFLGGGDFGLIESLIKTDCRHSLGEGIEILATRPFGTHKWIGVDDEPENQLDTDEVPGIEI
jgi:hypothetical protein